METEVRETDYLTRRRPWTAVFLSLLMPGLGQIYCGSFITGLVIIAVVAFFTTVAWVVGISHEATPFIPFTILMWGVASLATVLAAIDAYRRARRTRYDYPLKDYNHWVVYLLLIWISGAGWIVYAFYFRESVARAYRIATQSMVPTIRRGDQAIANRMAYDSHDPQIGDVVAFDNPANRQQTFIKRIVALGGDTVEVRNGRLLINGRMLETERVGSETIIIEGKKVEGEIFMETNRDAKYQIFLAENESETPPQDFGPVTVPGYYIFVMGDNRNISEDSRSFGALSVGALKGKYTQVYWPPAHWKSLRP